LERPEQEEPCCEYRDDRFDTVLRFDSAQGDGDRRRDPTVARLPQRSLEAMNDAAYRMIWIKAALLASPLMVVGCAQQSAYHWAKQGGGGDLSVDSYSCERDARQSGYYGTGLVGALNMKGFYDRCMQAQGWYQVDDAPAKQFTAPEWDSVRQACIADMRGYSERSGVPFPNAFDSCMKSKGF
jgi:hypothetical protein